MDFLAIMIWCLVLYLIDGFFGLSSELDLGQHPDQELVDVVVDARGGLDVLAPVLDRNRFAGWKQNSKISKFAKVFGSSLKKSPHETPKV
jgi:hypothetical protein